MVHFIAENDRSDQIKMEHILEKLLVWYIISMEQLHRGEFGSKSGTQIK